MFRASSASAPMAAATPKTLVAAAVTEAKGEGDMRADKSVLDSLEEAVSAAEGLLSRIGHRATMAERAQLASDIQLVRRELAQHRKQGGARP